MERETAAFYKCFVKVFKRYVITFFPSYAFIKTFQVCSRNNRILRKLFILYLLCIEKICQLGVNV